MVRCVDRGRTKDSGARQFGLDRDALAALAAASVRSSFAAAERKRELLGEVEAWQAG